jgi:hypothetical protein
MESEIDHILKFFAFAHLPDHLQGPSRLCFELAVQMARGAKDRNECAAGLRKLLEAKDCFVRAML